MLYDDPPHVVDLYSSTTNNSNGGAQISYSVAQSTISCLINQLDARTMLMYAQQQIVVTDCIGMQTAYLTATPQPGWKAIATDTGRSFLIKGIRTGRGSALGTIPPLTYLDCEEIL